ncbi:MAG: hypothetical protein M0Z65_08990 [Firmicutes bacterium]|nr:hypothetical protein [Bacillota bacterium]
MDHLNGTPLVVEWIDGSKMEGMIDTIYETDNHLEMDEDGYREYIACLLRVKAILSQPAHSIGELSSIDPPSKIYLKEVPPIWDDRCMG